MYIRVYCRYAALLLSTRKPEAVYWEDRNNRDVKYGPEDDSGEGWTTTLEVTLN